MIRVNKEHVFNIFRKSIASSIGLFTGLLIFLVSCISPDPITDLEPQEKDVYITNRDSTIDFSGYQTYFIVDSVRFITRIQGASDTTSQPAPLILSTINIELAEAGFLKVNTPQEADLGITVSVLKFSEMTPESYYPYVGGVGYFGYTSPAFFGFPGYTYGFPPYFGYFDIQAGSISIEMFDLEAARNTNQNTLNVIWSALLVGSLADQSAGAGSGERIVKAITSAFDQSPYLNTDSQATSL